MGLAALFGQVIQTGYHNIEMQGASEAEFGLGAIVPCTRISWL